MTCQYKEIWELFILFEHHHSSHPVSPESGALRREKLKSSTKNGTRKGSVYNNFSLVSVFCQAKDDTKNDRMHVKSLDTALKRCRINEKKFLEKAY